MNMPPRPASPATGDTGARRSRLLQTAEGATNENFTPTQWLMVAAIATIWGSSFLLIDVALDALSPRVVAAGRILLGTMALSIFPRARVPLPREAWGRTALLGSIWIAVPLALFPIAQQWITSSLAGIVNGAVPIFTGLWAAILLRRLPARRQLVGLAIGFVGVAMISLPKLVGGVTTTDASTTDAALGVVLVLIAVALYGLSINLAVPLQQAHGSLSVLWRAQLAACVLILPYGATGLAESTFAWIPVLALVPLGALGTGAAFAVMATLAGDVGSARASIAIYFVPLVAVALGMGLRGDSVSALALAGMLCALAGARLVSRKT